MKKKLFKFLLLAAITGSIIFTTGFLTYRYIMLNMIIETQGQHTAFATIFGQTDEYYME